MEKAVSDVLWQLCLDAVQIALHAANVLQTAANQSCTQPLWTETEINYSSGVMYDVSWWIDAGSFVAKVMLLNLAFISPVAVVFVDPSVPGAQPGRRTTLLLYLLAGRYKLS